VDIQSLVVPALTVLATGAVAWGVIRSEVSAMKDDAKQLRKDHEDLKDKAVTREMCREAHIRTDKGFDEMKADIKDLKRLMNKILFKLGGPAEE
jgi:hypothetical protein